MEIVTRFLIAILIILSFSLFVAVASNNPGEDYTKKKEVLSYIDLVSKKNNLVSKLGTFLFSKLDGISEGFLSIIRR